MTPKEKAIELIDKYIPHTRVFHEVLGWEDYIDSAKQCALIAVDEIYNGGLNLRYGAYLDEFEDKQNYYSYWEDVKKEINQLIIKNK
jgi:hypothetical protein